MAHLDADDRAALVVAADEGARRRPLIRSGLALHLLHPHPHRLCEQLVFELEHRAHPVALARTRSTTSVARTSRAMKSKYSAIASRPTRAARMRSDTSSPLVLRRSCTNRTTSRANPRLRSDSSRVRSSATTSPPSRETAKPCWPLTRSCTSSGDNATGSPSRVTVTERPSSSASAAAAPSSSARAGLRSLTRSFRRGPSVLKFGTSSNWITSLSSSAMSISSTLSSSATMSRRYLRSVGREEDEGARQGLTHLDRGLATGGTPQRGQPPGQRHLRLELPVDQVGVRRRPVGQVHRLVLGGAGEVAPHGVRHEGAERGQQQPHRGQHGVQRRLRRQRVAGGRVGVGTPEATPAAAHVPVGEVVDEAAEGGRNVVGLVAAEPLGHLDRRGGQARQDPTVERAAVGRSGHRGVGGVEPVQRRVGGEEAERVPQCEQHVAHRAVDGTERRPRRCPRRPLAEHPPPHRVGAPRVEDLPGIDDVAERLGHLAAVGVDDVPETHHVAIGALAEDQRVDGQQRVEPAPGLVDGLGDEVGREGERLRRSGRVRVADLGRRHGARVEPGVDHRLDPARHRQLVVGPLGGARRTDERHLVDRRTVRVEPRRRRARTDRTARTRNRRSARGRARSARSARACPSSDRATRPSRRCWPATRRSARV